MPTVTVLVDGIQVVNREVDNLECEETAGGTLDLHATFPSVPMAGPPTGTRLLECPTCPGAVTCSRCNVVRTGR